MTAHYYCYWGKTSDSLRKAYCTEQPLKEICAKYRTKIASKANILESQVNVIELEKLAQKEKWHLEKTDFSSYHLLPYHCLDVAAVAHCWWHQSKSLRWQFSQTMAVTEEQAYAWVMFFVTLHDLGKLDLRFQSKSPETLQQLQADISHYFKEPYYHGESSYACFIKEANNYGIGFLEEDTACNWMQQVAGHHGVIPVEGNYIELAFVDEKFKQRDKKARIEWIQDLKALFLTPQQIDFNDIPETVPTMLAGFCSICDWIGSSDYFHYQSKPNIELKTYFESRFNIANKALDVFGIFSKLKANKTLSTLFPEHLTAKGLQTITHKLPIFQNLTLIEAPTGSGKTETALVYAANLLHQGLAESIIFALPSQATANAMLERLEKMAEQLFIEGANVVLAHGKSSLRALEKPLRLSNENKPAQGEQEATKQGAKWLGASKKRAFLGQIGVCTIDQVLLSVLPVKHKFVRSFGIQKSVLIVDEVHAYDSYMYGLLNKVLEQQQQASGSVLLLSATLAQQQRDALALSWNTNIEKTTTYPLITQIYANESSNTFEIEDPLQHPEPRQVDLETWVLPELQFNSESRQKIIQAAEQGAKIAIICNLVLDAQDLFQLLRNETQIAVDLFHSRFRFKDRQQKEVNVKKYYGKDKKYRAITGRILVATQVVEQSLDLDFDWMITQLCPVDLLFQRLGRLHRHQRDKKERPDNFREPRCVVIIPEQESEYGNTQYVYKDNRVLWRTQQLIIKNAKVIFPKAYREWIEKVYQLDAWQDEPVEITAAYQKYHNEVQMVAKMTAKWVVELETKPLSDESDKANCLTRDGEMSLTLLPFSVQEGKTCILEGKPLDKTDWQYWNTLSLNTVSVPNSWDKRLKQCDKKEGIRYLEMEKLEDKTWRVLLEDGEQLIYSCDLGLLLQKY